VAKKSTGLEFLHGTQHENQLASDQKKGLEQPAIQVPYEESDGPIIALQNVKQIRTENISLRDAIESRKTVRMYETTPITLEDLTYALYMTQGVKRNVKNKATFRTVPSAGARHAFETILLVNNVEGLKRGLYRYLALEHKLQKLESAPDINQKIRRAALKQPQIEEAGVVFLWVADSYRMTYRYSERGYRYMFLDAGHVAQNLYLVAKDFNAGVCAIAAYDDEKMNALLGLDGEHQFVIYMASLGKI
jgi:SagB-type dehydrogenase family enzyme